MNFSATTITSTTTASNTCSLPPISDILMSNSSRQGCRERNRSNSVPGIAHLLNDSCSLNEPPLSPVSTIASASSNGTEQYYNPPAVKQQQAPKSSSAATHFRNCFSTAYSAKAAYHPPYYQQHHYLHSSNTDEQYCHLKAKRKRASPNQLVVLNRIFSQTYFPSTEVRIELGKKLGMSPRTVQIWFQNKRQALRARGRQQQQQQQQQQQHQHQVPPPMISTASANPHHHQQYNNRIHHPYHHNPHPYANARAPAVAEAGLQEEAAFCYLPPLLSPPRSPASSIKPPMISKYSLPPLKLPAPTTSDLRSPTLCASYPSPNSSVDFPPFREF